jgi:hypothetical protein
MGCTYLFKILAISSNPHTIMLLLIVGEFGYPEVVQDCLHIWIWIWAIFWPWSIDYKICHLSLAYCILPIDLVCFLKMSQVTFVIVYIIHCHDCLFEEITDMVIELLNSGCKYKMIWKDMIVRILNVIRGCCNVTIHNPHNIRCEITRRL